MTSILLILFLCYVAFKLFGAALVFLWKLIKVAIKIIIGFIIIKILIGIF